MTSEERKKITTAKGRPAYEAICDLVLELGQWDTEGKFTLSRRRSRTAGTPR